MLERRKHRFFGIVNASRPGKLKAFFAGNFRHGPVRCEIALENPQPAGCLDGLVDRMHDFLSRRLLGLRRFLADGLPRHRHRRLIDQLRIGETLRDERHAAGRKQVVRHELP